MLNFIQIRLDLRLFCTMFRGLLFSRHSVCQSNNCYKYYVNMFRGC